MIHSFLLLLASYQEEPPRLRTVLPNGAIILAERMPEAKTVSVQLFASSRRVPENAETSGRRHLLEHILARGPKKNLDQRLETSGAFLGARTHRDAMQFDITCSPGRLDLALQTVSELLKPMETTPEEVQREAKVIEQEIALMADPQRLGAAAWKQAYGSEGLDPIGNLEVVGKVTVADLQELQKRHFATDGLVLIVVGPINPADVMTRAKKIVGDLPREAGAGGTARRGEGQAGRTEALGGFGEARAARVSSYKDVKTMAALAAALGIASQFDAAFVTYTPTAQNGLIIVGRTDENSGLGMKLDALQPHEEADMFPLGVMLAKAWVEGQMRTPAGLATLRGLLLAQGEANRPELMLDAIAQISFKDFQEGIKRFKTGQAVISVGVRG